MTINQGLKSIVENTPNFSNQGLENTVNTIKIGWVAKSIDLDTEIQNNTVLTNSQKTDLKDTINNLPHINVGRFIGDLLRHSESIIDGSIVPAPDADSAASFLELLQTVQSLQTIIPQLFGVPSSAKSRDIDDHFGTLNGILLQTEDSSEPVFTKLKNSISFLNSAGLSTHTSLQTAIDNLKNFIIQLQDDSTDFQQTLDSFGTALANAQTDFNNALANEPYLSKKNDLIDSKNKINTQVSLENSNLTGIRTYTENLTDNLAYTNLATNNKFSALMSKVAQNKNWQTYFTNYNKRNSSRNPLYSQQDQISDILKLKGLPDVVDHFDLESVASKAKRDSRLITTVSFQGLTTEQSINAACDFLKISKANKNIYALSQSLLANMNKHDVDVIKNQIDVNEQADSIN